MLIDFLQHFFPVSGVNVNVLIPPFVAMLISFFTSMGGISGAFLLLPFQMSVLHYTSPSVSGTNHVYNIFAIPSGVYRYIKEGRMAWPLTWVMIFGTIPGVFAGYYIRVVYLPNPGAFKFFAGCLLAFIGMKLLYGLFVGPKTIRSKVLEGKYTARVTEAKNQHSNPLVVVVPAEAVIRTCSISPLKITYEFWDERFSFNPMLIFLLSFFVGIIGGAYGIGGGSIIAPLCVALFHLPVYSIAGATLMGTFITSVAGALFYSVIPVAGHVSAEPDWALGILFGIGGFVGMYLGARFQKFMPQTAIKLMLGIIIMFLAINYIIQYF